MPNLWIAFFVTIIFQSLLKEIHSEASGKIVGGTKIKIEKYPYMAAVKVRAENEDIHHLCGGVYIWSKWVATAANCFMDYKSVERFTCTMGAARQDGPHQTRRVEYIIEHSDFNRDTFQNNIAVVKVASPFDLEKKVALAPKTNISYANFKGQCTVIGWGSTKPGKQDRSNELYAVKIPIVSQSLCEEHVGPHIAGHIFGIDTMCAGTKDMKNMCKGDEGGPLICEDNVIGLASVGDPRCKYPASFTNVTHFGWWIYKAVTADRNKLKLRPGAESNIYIRALGVVNVPQYHLIEFCLFVSVMYN